APSLKPRVRLMVRLSVASEGTQSLGSRRGEPEGGIWRICGEIMQKGRRMWAPFLTAMRHETAPARWLTESADAVDPYTVGAIFGDTAALQGTLGTTLGDAVDA